MLIPGFCSASGRVESHPQDRTLVYRWLPSLASQVPIHCWVNRGVFSSFFIFLLHSLFFYKNNSIRTASLRFPKIKNSLRLNLRKSGKKQQQFSLNKALFAQNAQNIRTTEPHFPSKIEIFFSDLKQAKVQLI